MRKRVDNDATQEVSSSQIEPDVRKSPYPVISKNDASMWLSQPVSADDFVQPPRKRPPAPKKNNWVAAVGAAVVAGAIGVGVWYVVLRDGPKQTTAATTPAPVAQPGATPDAAVAGAAVVTDAAIAAVADAAVAPATGMLQVDAISAADPAAKKKRATKRGTAKKKVVKKKTATAPKKKR